eukprot:Skav231496  [mRNA]  locus=scaffold354:101417:103489:- [translate_table: standard]
MFIDVSFPPSDASLWGKGERRCYEQLEWLRPQQLSAGPAGSLFAKPSRVSDIRQGLLSDCYLVAAIALLARQPSLLSRLFVAYRPEEGWYTVKLFLNGCWEPITLDTFLPCFQGRPAFAHHVDDEVYACFIEKACAKAYGSYAALTGGHFDEALWDLTGLPVEEVNLSRAPPNLAQKIWQHWEQGDLLACACISTGALNAQRMVRPDHVYVVTDVSRVAGLGTPRLEVANLAEEETLWLEGHDLLQTFNRLSICHAGKFHAAQSHASTYKLEVTDKNAGGCSNFPTFHRNSMFKVSVSDRGCLPWIAITVSQPDLRHISNELNFQATYPQIGLTVLCMDNLVEVESDLFDFCTKNRRKILLQTAFSSKRNVSAVLQLESLPAGTEYRIVPSYFFPEDLGHGKLMVHIAAPQQVSVERLSPRIGTTVAFRGTFRNFSVPRANEVHTDCSAALAPMAVHPKASVFRVVSDSQVVPVTVVLTQSPEESLCWWARDATYASLHRCYQAFDLDQDQLLSPQELESLCLAMFVHMPHIGEDRRKSLLAGCRLTGLEFMNFGQFLSHVLRQRISRGDLQRAADLTVPTAGAATCTPRSAYIGAAALCNFSVDINPSEANRSDLHCSLAAGCKMPVMSDVNVWSASFLVRQSEFYLCPLVTNMAGLAAEDLSFQLQVLSPLEGLVVQQFEAHQLGEKR